MIRLFPFNLAANESRTADVSGEYFEIRQSAYPVTVELLDAYGGVVSLMEDIQQSDFCKPGSFGKVRITNGAIAQKVVFWFGSGDAGSRRVSGDVSIIDGEKNRTLGGGMFAGAAICGNGGANYSNTQLWNPLGTGKNLVVTAASAALFGGSGAVNYCFSNVMLNAASVNAVANKKAGAVGGVALLRRELTAAVGSNGSAILRNETLPSTTSLQWVIKGALIVPPGYGLQIASEVTNFSLNTSLEWFEEVI